LCGVSISLDEMKPVVQVTNVLVLRAPAMGMARPRGRVGATPAKMVVIGWGAGGGQDHLGLLNLRDF
jgi:hypothetical protein